MTGVGRCNEQDCIDSQASAWLIAITDTRLPPHQQREFDAWCSADPRNAATYAEMRATWDDIPALTGLAQLVPVAKVAPAHERHPAGARRWRPLAIGALSALAAAAIAVVAVPPELYRPAPRYATALGEIRTLTLPDGSTVVLGAKSAIALAFTPTERRVVLTGGEAYFDVIHNPARPFAVEAGDSIVRDVGTQFNVNVAQGSVRVSVVEGRVAVARSGARAAPQQQLRAGQRVELLAAIPDASTSAGTATAPITILPSSSPVAWRDGRLIYDNVRLADLAADVNRYYAPGVTLATPTVGEVRVTASFRTGEIAAFMTALSATLPVRAERDDQGAFLLREVGR